MILSIVLHSALKKFSLDQCLSSNPRLKDFLSTKKSWVGLRRNLLNRVFLFPTTAKQVSDPCEERKHKRLARNSDFGLDKDEIPE